MDNPDDLLKPDLGQTDFGFLGLTYLAGFEGQGRGALGVCYLGKHDGKRMSVVVRVP